MSFVGDAIGSVVGGVTGAKQSAKAAGRAAATQAAAAQAGIEEQQRAAQAGIVEQQTSTQAGIEEQQRSTQAGIEEQQRRFSDLVNLMAPYVQAGSGAIGRLAPYEQAGQQAFGQQQALIGLQGPAAQQQAIAALESSPQFQALQQQGENAILQNASATGGLRGGNVQAALAQFRPQVLNSLIEQQYGRLGGIAGAGLGVTGDLVSLGQASASGQGLAGLESASDIGNLLTGRATNIGNLLTGRASNIGNLLTGQATNVGNLLANQGAATAGGQLAKGNVARGAFGDLLSIGKVAASF